MKVKWHDLTLEKSDSKPLPSRKLHFKISNFDQTLDLTIFNIICQNEAVKDRMLQIFSKLHDKFDNLQIRLGWLDAEGQDSLEDLDHGSIFIGDKTTCYGFKNLFKKQVCIVSNFTDYEHALCLGYQRHLGINVNPQSLSLGEIRYNMTKAEAIMRRSSAIIFDLSAIRKQESFIDESFVTGLDIFESCALLKSAGMAKNKKLMVFNFGEELLNNNSAEIVSLLIWYYLEGAMDQNMEKIEHNNNKLYMVHNPYFEKPLKFIQGNITGRWWYQNPETLYYVACTEEDYLEISKGRIPDEFLVTDPQH